MRRKVVINWSPGHQSIRDLHEETIDDWQAAAETGKGWSYVTFVDSRVARSEILYNVDSLEITAVENGYFIPAKEASQHNKIVVEATSVFGDPVHQLFGLTELLKLLDKEYSSADRYPYLEFYGKLGGIYDRSEKGRVLVIYSKCVDNLLEIDALLDDIFKKIKIKGVVFEKRLSNGLSALPRMLEGFDDPQYRNSGATQYRITDIGRFAKLLELAREDCGKYMFYSELEK